MKKSVPSPLKNSRPLTHEDVNIWQRVAKTVHPLSNLQGTPHQNARSYIHIPPTPSPVLHHSKGEIQIRADKNTRRGKVEIGKKIDLHDLTRDQAFPKLERGLFRAQAQGMRTVLVVTGKGPNLEGILRKSLPGWLAHPDIRGCIADYAPAHIRHGGGGAFYVFLKKK